MAGMKLQKGDIFSNHLQQKSYSLGLLLSFFLFSIFLEFFFFFNPKENEYKSTFTKTGNAFILHLSIHF